MEEKKLDARILSWLSKTGFPLEMEAAQTFREAGFEVRQSTVQLDPQEGKAREIDVLAEDPDWCGIVEIYFVVECKSSDQPWIVFTSEDTLQNYNSLFAFAIMSPEARAEIVKKKSHSDGLKDIMQRSSKSGYALRQAFAEKTKDTAYSAAMAALKACYVVTQVDKERKLPSLKFAFPIIVVDSPLFECEMSADGTLKINQVEKSDFLFSSFFPENVSCCINIITKNELKKMAGSYKNIASRIRAEFQYVEDEVLHFKK